MEKYILLGVVHPERALIESHQINITFSHPATKKSGKLGSSPFPGALIKNTKL